AAGRSRARRIRVERVGGDSRRRAGRGARRLLAVLLALHDDKALHRRLVVERAARVVPFRGHADARLARAQDLAEDGVGDELEAAIVFALVREQVRDLVVVGALLLAVEERASGL